MINWKQFCYFVSWFGFVICSFIPNVPFEKLVIAGIFGLYFTIVYYAEKK